MDLIKTSGSQFDQQIDKIDELMLNCMQEMELKYLNQLTAFLKRKEKELESVLAQIIAKYATMDSKDLLLLKMRKVINKIESDGRVVLGQLRGSQNLARDYKHQMEELEQSNLFLERKAKEELAKQKIYEGAL